MNNQSLALTEALGHTISDKRLEILRRVGQSGSISQAAREAGISYKAAWQALDTLSNLSGWVLVERTVGGSGGGGARVTPQGLELLALADALNVARQQVLAQFAGGAQLAGGLGLKTSMRNQLLGEVLTCEPLAPQDPMVLVVVRLSGGDRVTACITRESAELLALQAGLAVLVLCKATAVAVGAANLLEQTQKEGVQGNWLEGRVARVSCGALRDEVVLTLSGDLQLVGFAEKPNNLRVGSRGTARVDGNALVLAQI